MKVSLRKYKRLRILHKRVHRRLGDNLYLVMGIMSVLLVFSGLVIGLLGRGWAGAWFLVMLGLMTGFFPCLSILMESEKKPVQKKPEPVVIQSDRVESPMQRKRRREQDEASKKAIELEALIAREQIKKRDEQRRREAELLKQEERIRSEFRARERQRIIDEKRRQKQKEKERRENNERESAKWDKASASGNVIRPNASRKKKAPGYFEGVSSYSELKKRYKELMKKYHPDNGGNNPEIMLKIQKEYDEFERFFKSYEKHK